MPPPGPELIRLAQAWVARRDEAAAREVMRTLHPLVAGIARRHLPFLHEIEDVVQWMRVFEHLHRWQPSSPLEAWVARIAVNACLKRLRTRRRKPTLRWSELSPEQQQAALSLQHGGALETAPGEGRELLQALLDTLRRGPSNHHADSPRGTQPRRGRIAHRHEQAPAQSSRLPRSGADEGSAR